MLELLDNLIDLVIRSSGRDVGSVLSDVLVSSNGSVLRLDHLTTDGDTSLRSTVVSEKVLHDGRDADSAGALLHGGDNVFVESIDLGKSGSSKLIIFEIVFDSEANKATRVSIELAISLIVLT